MRMKRQINYKFGSLCALLFLRNYVSAKSAEGINEIQEN